MSGPTRQIGGGTVTGNGAQSEFAVNYGSWVLSVSGGTGALERKGSDGVWYDVSRDLSGTAFALSGAEMVVFLPEVCDGARYRLNISSGTPTWCAEQ